MGRQSLQDVGSVVIDKVPWEWRVQWSQFVVRHDVESRNQETSWGIWRRRRRVMAQQTGGMTGGVGPGRAGNSEMGVKMHWLGLGSFVHWGLFIKWPPGYLFMCV